MIPFIETWPLHRRPGHHAALVWIDGAICVVYFGVSLQVVIEKARQFAARVVAGELAI